MATIAELIGRSRTAYQALATVGEAVDDEWEYITDLQRAWLAALDQLVTTRGAEGSDAQVEAAVDRLIDEVGRISDPHRAIDWLSTFPQAILLAIGEA
jgi:hypothetical protein